MPDNAIARAIRQARSGLRWSQQELADRLEVKRQTVSAWENGTNQPQAAQLGALREVLGDRFVVPEIAAVQGYPVLEGRSVELEALQGYVLERQRVLTAAIRAAGAGSGPSVANQPQRTVYDAPRPAAPLKQVRKLKGR